MTISLENEIFEQLILKTGRFHYKRVYNITRKVNRGLSYVKPRASGRGHATHFLAAVPLYIDSFGVQF